MGLTSGTQIRCWLHEPLVTWDDGEASHYSPREREQREQLEGLLVSGLSSQLSGVGGFCAGGFDFDLGTSQMFKFYRVRCGG